MMAVLPCQPTGSLALTQACWLGWSSWMTRCQAAARSESLSTGSPALSSSRVPMTGRPAAALGPVTGSTGLSTPCERGCHLVETACRDVHARTGREPDDRRSKALFRPAGGGAGGTAGKGRGERGETRRGPNITPLGRVRQGAIHRFWNACGGRADEGRVPRRFPQPAPPTGPAAGAEPGDLTWSIAPRVPFLGHPVSTGAACPCHSSVPAAVEVRGWAVPAEATDPVSGFDQLRPTLSGDLAEAPA